MEGMGKERVVEKVCRISLPRNLFDDQLTPSRLSFHLFVRDAQASMTSLTNPHAHFAEMSLPLPAARELWFAKTAQEWKHHYLKHYSEQSGTQLSISDLLRSPGLLTSEQHRVDFQLSVSIVLHAFWNLIHDYHKLTTVAGDPALAQAHQSHLFKTLDAFRQLVLDNNPHVLSAQDHLMVNLLQMHLHVSLAELQLFLGKEGDDQAKRTYPSLQQWAQESDSRRAIWHAGQVLRYAREFPLGHLKDFYAVAVHQAALTLWTWGVVTRARKRANGQATGFNRLSEPVFLLDGLESPQQFISYGIGRPAIMGLSTKEAGHGNADVGMNTSQIRGGGQGVECFVEDPTSCMRAVADIFSKKFPSGNPPAMVENLAHLIRQLGMAPRGMGMD